MNIEQGWKAKTLGEKRVPVPLKIKSRISEKVRVAESQESSPCWRNSNPVTGFYRRHD